MIVVFAVLIALFAAPAAQAQSGGAAAPTASGFTASPSTVTEGTAVTFAFNAVPKALTRVDLIAPGKPAVRAKLGRVDASGAMKATWTATLTPGQYTARLVVTVRGTQAVLPPEAHGRAEGRRRSGAAGHAHGDRLEDLPGPGAVHVRR